MFLIQPSHFDWVYSITVVLCHNNSTRHSRSFTHPLNVCRRTSEDSNTIAEPSKNTVKKPKTLAVAEKTSQKQGGDILCYWQINQI